MRTLILALIVLASQTTVAQFNITNPYVTRSTHPNLSIEEIHVYPDKITVDFLFRSDYSAGGYRYGSQSFIEYTSFREKKYVSALKNADYNSFTYVKVGKKGKVFCDFPFFLLRDDVQQSE